MGKLFDTAVVRERAVLVGLITQSQDTEKVQEYLEELEFLASTLSIDTEKSFTQALTKADLKTFVGKGKLEEIKNYIKDNHIDFIADLYLKQLTSRPRRGFFEGVADKTEPRRATPF